MCKYPIFQTPRLRSELLHVLDLALVVPLLKGKRERHERIHVDDSRSRDSILLLVSRTASTGSEILFNVHRRRNVNDRVIQRPQVYGTPTALVLTTGSVCRRGGLADEF